MFVLSDTVFSIGEEQYRLVVYKTGWACLYHWVETPKGSLWRFAAEGTRHPMHQALLESRAA